jgi:hypothetical protein
MASLAQRAAALVRFHAMSTDLDKRTSMADARIALCVARGVDMDDIDPASGYNYSRDAYNRARESWVWNIKQHGFNSAYDEPPLQRAMANWASHRPDFIAGDDWLAAGRAAHRAHWANAAVTCNFTGDCDICTTDDERAKVEQLEADGRTPGEVWEVAGLARCTACGHLMHASAPTTLPDHYCARRQPHTAA